MLKNKITKLTILAALCYGTGAAQAQETDLQAKYRQMAVAYSHDLKAAEKAIDASMQLVQAAGKDLYPKISGDASANYTGNPMQLTLDLPSFDTPITFVGKDVKYGAGITLTQPIYTGGRLKETIRAARYRYDISTYTKQMVRTAVCCHADVQYWNTVARKEIVGIAHDYYNSVASLVQTIRERVEAGMTDRQDLLMMEVKLNEAEFQLAQAEKDFDNSMMALNSLVGFELNNPTEIDDSVAIVTDNAATCPATDRPEMKIAEAQVKLAQSDRRITASKYKPQISLGIDGTYSSPGYNFHSDLDPNYAIYAKVSVPIFQWGKRSHEIRASELKTHIALDNANKVLDDINLEIQSARNSLQKAIRQASLAHNSLSKALDNENMAVERYREGRASVIELIEAQTYRQHAQMNFVQAKVVAQTDYSMLLKAINGYNTL
ncbi:MAG: TolC family protein [Muribaculaceae bacterium]